MGPVTIERALDVQGAYAIATERATRTVAELFWAIDCLWHDNADQTDDVRAQRFEQTQLMATELDTRGVAMRDPRSARRYPGVRP